MTHHFASRFPEDLWGKMEQIAKSNNCSINSLLVKTMQASIDIGSSLSWTQTMNYAATSGPTPTMYNFTSSAASNVSTATQEFREILAKGRELLAEEREEENETL